MKNIVLIGMPGCGKSTVGVVLAKILGYRFLDSDLLIQESENRLLQAGSGGYTGTTAFATYYYFLLHHHYLPFQSMSGNRSGSLLRRRIRL